MHHDLRKAMTNRNRMLRKIRKTKSADDWNIYKVYEILAVIKSTKSSFQRDLLEQHSTNPRKFWKVIKEIFPFKNKAVVNVGNMTKDALQNQANVFGMYFSTAVNLLKEKSIRLIDFIWRCPKRLTLRTSVFFKLQNEKTEFVLKELKQLKWHKACDVDDLPPGMLKDCCEHTYQLLCHIINLSIGTNKIPSAWKIAKVIPVHKKGHSGDPENYRPISVLPVLSKILEKVIHQ